MRRHVGQVTANFFLPLAIVVGAFVLLTGCSSSSEASEAHAGQDTIESSEIVDYNQHSAESLGQIQGIFVLNGEGDYYYDIPYEVEGFRGDAGYSDATTDISFPNDVSYVCTTTIAGDAPYKIDRDSGDLLVTVSDESVSGSATLIRCIESGYWQGSAVSADIGSYAEIGGIDVSAIDLGKNAAAVRNTAAFWNELGVSWCRYFESKAAGLVGTGSYSPATEDDGAYVDHCEEHILLRSQTPLSLPAGWYDGTDYNEGSININEPYYIFDQSIEYSAPIEKTKDGYFIIDVSNLESGIYRIYNSGSHFIIDIE